MENLKEAIALAQYLHGEPWTSILLDRIADLAGELVRSKVMETLDRDLDQHDYEVAAWIARNVKRSLLKAATLTQMVRLTKLMIETKATLDNIGLNRSAIEALETIVALLKEEQPVPPALCKEEVTVTLDGNGDIVGAYVTPNLEHAQFCVMDPRLGFGTAMVTPETLAIHRDLEDRVQRGQLGFVGLKKLPEAGGTTPAELIRKPVTASTLTPLHDVDQDLLELLVAAANTAGGMEVDGMITCEDDRVLLEECLKVVDAYCGCDINAKPSLPSFQDMVYDALVKAFGNQ